MSKAQAEDFLDQIRRTRDPRIAQYRRMIIDKCMKFGMRGLAPFRGESNEKIDEASEDESRAIIAGLQLAIFEIIWGGFDWIERIFFKMSKTDSAIYFECREEPSNKDWDDCCYLIGEMLDVMFGNDRVRDISRSVGKRPSEEFVEIMSSSIFRKIAEKHAPWRLPT